MDDGRQEPERAKDLLIASLQRQVRDLAALLTLSGTWKGRREEDIARNVPEVLVNLLRADIAHCRVVVDEQPLEFGRPHVLGAELHRELSARASGENQYVASVRTSDGRELFAVYQGTLSDVSVVVAASRPDFPAAHELFLLRAALDQAIVALKNARLVREVEAANRRKDEFIAMLGHELRNPLAPIFTALHLMRLRGEGSTEHEREVIERQARHLGKLVDDLLDVSRIVRGKVQLKREPLQVKAVVTQAIEMAAPVLEQRRHRLHTDVGPELWLLGDSIRLAQVVANLLTNAAKYTKPGGDIRIQARALGELAEIRVIDNGVGIVPALLPHVFDLFVQDARSTERAAGGLGLGLALVKSLVAAHGGTVSAHSAGTGCGSEFVVRLPALVVDQRSAPSPVESKSVEPSALPDAPSVLVVDDNVDAAEMLAEALRAHGFSVEIAYEAIEALERAGRKQFGVAVLDIGLPVMDGYELARRLRDFPPPHPRLFAVTGYGNDLDRARSREAGFERHLVKPVDLVSLVEAITQDPTGRV